jgi:hypothetical protein
MFKNLVRKAAISLAYGLKGAESVRLIKNMTRWRRINLASGMISVVSCAISSFGDFFEAEVAVSWVSLFII